MMGFELMTSSLPRMRSTPELHRLFYFLFRAENEVRTRDPQLGRLMLYQLSYFRKKVGGGGLEPPNPKERIYSPPQLPLCDPPKLCLMCFRHQSEPMGGFEPSTPRLQITCSGQLSYIGNISSLYSKGLQRY